MTIYTDEGIGKLPRYLTLALAYPVRYVANLGIPFGGR